ncbi:MAG TPA: glycosyl hydrolase family 18 protein [Polyangiaceae bacterium]|jgi:GH18 family chitinase
MNVRSALACAAGLLYAALSPAGCSGAPSGDGGANADAGAETLEDAGTGVIPPAADSGAVVDAGGGSVADDAGGGGTADAGHPSGGDAAVDAGNDAGPSTPAIKAVMYLPNWSGSFSSWATKIDFTKMTHLNLAFGTIDSNSDWNMGASDSDVQALAKAAHDHQVKVLVSIGGADDDLGILNQYGSASNIAPMVANLDAMVTRLDLDGVDVDLERGAMMKSSSNYPAFVKALVATFRPKGMLVTTALAQYIAQDANTDATLQAVYQSFDFINDMIYTTNLSDYTSEAAWWTGSQGIDKTKLCLGVEFTSGLSTSTAVKLTQTSKDYGGVMIWEYSQPTEGTLWPAVQGAL